MTQKTEIPAPENAPELSTAYLGSLIIASLIVLLLVFGGGLLTIDPLSMLHIRSVGPIPVLAPWVGVGGVTIANGLSEFCGEALTPVDNAFRIAGLIGILILGVFVPTLTLFLMGKREGAAVSAPVRAIYLVAAIMAGTFAVFVIPMGIVSARVTASLKSAQAVQENKDHMINDLNMIAWKIREFRILPKTLGGGGGSVSGYVMPSDIAKTADGTYAYALAASDTKGPTGTAIVTIHAVSVLYPDAAIDVMLDQGGHLMNWTYKGPFL